MSSPFIHIDLFNRIGKGDESAFRDIFHIYTPRLHSFIYKIVKSSTATENLIQDVFMKLWLNREEVAHKDDPSSWLFTVASHQAFNYLKKMSNSQRYIDYVKRESLQPASQPEAELQLILKEKQAAYHQALDQLPQQRRIIFRMSREQLLTHKEIAEKLQISPFTVKNQLIAALGFLRKHLHRNDALFLVGLTILRNIIF